MSSVLIKERKLKNKMTETKQKTAKLNFKTGDKIIHFGQVYKIFGIKKKENKQGESSRILEFKPYFPSETNRSLVFSIPEENLEKTNIRKPLSTKTVNKLLRRLRVRFKSADIPDAGVLREKLDLNSSVKLVRVLRQLWRDKQNKETNFTNSKQNVFELALKKLAQEVALVKNIKLDQAKEKIKQELKKSS